MLGMSNSQGQSLQHVHVAFTLILVFNDFISNLCTDFERLEFGTKWVMTTFILFQNPSPPCDQYQLLFTCKWIKDMDKKKNMNSEVNTALFLRLETEYKFSHFEEKPKP